MQDRHGVYDDGTGNPHPEVVSAGGADNAAAMALPTNPLTIPTASLICGQPETQEERDPQTHAPQRLVERLQAIANHEQAMTREGDFQLYRIARRLQPDRLFWAYHQLDRGFLALREQGRFLEVFLFKALLKGLAEEVRQHRRRHRNQPDAAIRVPLGNLTGYAPEPNRDKQALLAAFTEIAEQCGFRLADRDNGREEGIPTTVPLDAYIEIAMHFLVGHMRTRQQRHPLKGLLFWIHPNRLGQLIRGNGHL